MTGVSNESYRSTSLWWDTLPDDLVGTARPALAETRTADVCIIGAGYTGLWTAYYLSRSHPELDIVVVEAEVAGFGASLFASQILSGIGMPPNPQQSTANKITPVMITAMFLFFPLPAGVLLYMVVANIFQALQTWLLTREALPENLQAILDKQLSQAATTVTATAGGRMPFEPKGKK